MAGSRDVLRRIKSVRSTRKITRTMELVATSKLKRAMDRVAAARPYADAAQDLVSGLHSPALAQDHALLRRPAETRRAAVLLLTANRGFCGAFNANLIREAQNRLTALERAGTETELHIAGRKGLAYFRFRGRAVASATTAIGDDPSPDDAEALVGPLRERFAAGELDAVEIVSAQFRSAMSTPARTTRVLPVAASPATRQSATPPGARQPAASPATRQSAASPGARQPGPTSAAAASADAFILSPSAGEIVTRLLPAYVRAAVYGALAENAAGEQGARRAAMKSATDNAGDILDNLTRSYNRARQAQITQEIAEIVGGAAALE